MRKVALLQFWQLELNDLQLLKLETNASYARRTRNTSPRPLPAEPVLLLSSEVNVERVVRDQSPVVSWKD